MRSAWHVAFAASRCARPSAVGGAVPRAITSDGSSRPCADVRRVSDSPYVATRGAFVYVGLRQVRDQLVIDNHARRAVGSRANGTTFRIRTKRGGQALHGHGPAPRCGIFHHSDCGSRYMSITYVERLTTAGIEPSVGTVGDSLPTEAEHQYMVSQTTWIWRGDPKGQCLCQTRRLFERGFTSFNLGPFMSDYASTSGRRYRDRNSYLSLFVASSQLLFWRRRQPTSTLRRRRAQTAIAGRRRAISPMWIRGLRVVITPLEEGGDDGLP